MYSVTKTYGHNNGWSACFRQPGAGSHCRDPHGYPLSFEVCFKSKVLNADKWVIDFGGLKHIKKWLGDTFDHRTILAANDEALEDFQWLYRKHGFQEILVLPSVGCESFAKYVYDYIDAWIETEHFISIQRRGLVLASVKVSEHEGNSATYEGEQ